MANHTPGPWKVPTDNLDNQRTEVLVVKADDLRREIANLGKTTDEHKANGKLVAQAPAMLDILQKALPILTGLPASPELANLKTQISDVIKKATN